MNVYSGFGKPQGVGISGGEGPDGQRRDARVSLRATQERGGQFLSQLGGFQVSRRGQRGRKGELARGDKSKGNAPCIVVHW